MQNRACVKHYQIRYWPFEEPLSARAGRSAKISQGSDSYQFRPNIDPEKAYNVQVLAFKDMSAVNFSNNVVGYISSPIVVVGGIPRRKFVRTKNSWPFWIENIVSGTSTDGEVASSDGVKSSVTAVMSISSVLLARWI